jgi:hypothetical protein
LKSADIFEDFLILSAPLTYVINFPFMTHFYSRIWFRLPERVEGVCFRPPAPAIGRRALLFDK